MADPKQRGVNADHVFISYAWEDVASAVDSTTLAGWGCAPRRIAFCTR